MSKYTTEVRFICETFAGLKKSEGQASVNAILENCVDKIFDFDFPIFDEAYRKNLEKKILKHYYTREIGEETFGLWKLRLDTRLNEIMPYYNQLYKSELLVYNPLYTYNLTRKGNRKGTNGENLNTNNTSNGNTQSSTQANQNGTNYDLYSDTPQGALNGVDQETYLTTARKTMENGAQTTTNNLTSNDSSASTQVRDANSTEDYLEEITGYQGANASEMILKYRETFLNIDKLVIDELEDLFMQLW